MYEQHLYIFLYVLAYMMMMMVLLCVCVPFLFNRTFNYRMLRALSKHAFFLDFRTLDECIS